MRIAVLLATLTACSGGAADLAPLPEPLDPPPLAAGVVVDRVELVQAATVVLMDDGAGIPEASPVVAGRPGLLRVYLAHDERPDTRPVDVTLTWTFADGSEQVQTLEDVALTPGGGERLSDTANFELDGTEIRDGAAWSVALYETRAEVERTGDHERPGARFPAPGRGEFPLHLAPFDATVQVFVVPFAYTADGSGRLPPLQPERVNALREHLYKMYPVREVDLRVLDPQPTDVVIEASSGLGDLLEDLAAWRVEQQIPTDAYVYGLVQPASTFSAFCRSGCTTGLSYLVSNPNADGLRASVGVGFESVSADTFVHELGHAHGRRHAPCGNVGNPDPDYPHAGGSIGAPGWDVLTGELLDSRQYKDFMGYCTPRWVSAYQLDALHAHIMAVRGVQRLGEPTLESVWTVALRPGLTPRLRRVAEGVVQPGGAPMPVDVLDARGEWIQTVQGSAHAFGHGGGGTLQVPDAGGAAIRLPDGTVLWREDGR